MPVTTGIIYTVCILSVRHKSDYILYGTRLPHSAAPLWIIHDSNAVKHYWLFEGKMVRVNLVPTKMKMQDRVISPENSLMRFDFVFNKSVASYS
jgi:hypothetical protein